jgi:tellurite resistance protein
MLKEKTKKEVTVKVSMDNENTMLTYQDVVRKPNPMVNINPLKRGSGKTVKLEDRIKDLENTSAWKKTMKQWQDEGIKFELSRIPRVEMVELGSIEIDEDIQRPLDEKHCAKIAKPKHFDPALLQTLQCIKRSDGKFISTDGQHTASVIAALIDSQMAGEIKNWREYKFPVQYIETDDLAFARRAFSVLNGKGKKKQSAYQMLRNAVYIIRIDGNTTDEEEVALEKKVSVAEANECFPVEEDSSLIKYPGTFTNIATFKTLSDDEIDTATKWHNTYFHRDPIHVSLFFMFRDFCREFSSAKITITEKLQQELAGLIQNLFVDLNQYSSSVKEAHNRWHEKRYGYKGNWNDDAYACGLLHLYQRFGGKEKLPLTLLDRFDDLIDFFDQDILDLAK